jgi:hypothetical protein
MRLKTQVWLKLLFVERKILNGEGTVTVLDIVQSNFFKYTKVLTRE